MSIKFSILEDAGGTADNRKRRKFVLILIIILLLVIAISLVAYYESRSKSGSSSDKPSFSEFKGNRSSTSKSTETKTSNYTAGSTPKLTITAPDIATTKPTESRSTTNKPSVSDFSLATNSSVPKLNLTYPVIDTSKLYALMNAERGKVIIKSDSANYFIFANYGIGRKDLYYNVTQISGLSNTYSITSWQKLSLTANKMYDHKAALFESVTYGNNQNWIIEQESNRLVSIRPQIYPDLCLIDVFAADTNGHDGFSVLNDLRNCSRFHREKLWIFLPVC